MSSLVRMLIAEEDMALFSGWRDPEMTMGISLKRKRSSDFFDGSATFDTISPARLFPTVVLDGSSKSSPRMRIMGIIINIPARMANLKWRRFEITFALLVRSDLFNNANLIYTRKTLDKRNDEANFSQSELKDYSDLTRSAKVISNRRHFKFAILAGIKII